MSNPLIVTDKSPKFLLGIQRDVVNSQRYVGGIDTDWWWRPVASPVIAISGGSRDGHIFNQNEYTSTTSKEGTTILLNAALTDGSVVLYPQIDGYTVVKITDYVWIACKSLLLRISSGWESDTILSFSNRMSACKYSDNISLSPWFKQVVGSATAIITPNYAQAPDGSMTASRLQMSVSSAGDLAQLVQIVPTITGKKYESGVWVKSNTSSVSALFYGVTDVGSLKAIGGDWMRVGMSSVANSNYSATESPFRCIRLIKGTTSDSIDILVWRCTVTDGKGRDVKTESLLTTSSDAQAGAIDDKGSRSITLSYASDAIVWDNAVPDWGLSQRTQTLYTIDFTGDASGASLEEQDLDAVIKANEQLEVRGGLTIYNNLTINGKLYITQELGF